MTTKILTSVMLSLLLTGCAHKPVSPVVSKAVTIVPAGCLRRIAITDFKKDCTPLTPTTATCDDVRIRYECVSTLKAKPQ